MLYYKRTLKVEALYENILVAMVEPSQLNRIELSVYWPKGTYIVYQVR